MATIVTEGEGKVFEKPDTGLVQAVCSHVTDIGEQDTAYGPKRKVVLSFELAQKMQDGRPFMQSQFFTMSLHEKAALRVFLKSWRGKDLAPEELKGFDLDKLIGVNCMLNLVETITKDGKQFVNIASVVACPKGMPKIELYGQELPNWIAKKINATGPVMADDGTEMF